MPRPQLTEQPTWWKPWWRPFVIRQHARSYAPRRAKRQRYRLVNQASEWLLPWELKDYPGRWLGLVQAVCGRWKLETLRYYLKGQREMSMPVARALREAIRVRVEAGQALLAELDQTIAAGAETERRRREAGFMAVDPKTGESGRVKAGH